MRRVRRRRLTLVWFELMKMTGERRMVGHYTKEEEKKLAKRMRNPTEERYTQLFPVRVISARKHAKRTSKPNVEDGRWKYSRETEEDLTRLLRRIRTSLPLDSVPDHQPCEVYYYHYRV
jgi:hypothetical protein